ncbi:MAG: hypothetical protein QE487_01090 [Fluviicola sp.]|nr:hypothetical protein [Fluviicola sp.]
MKYHFAVALLLLLVIAGCSNEPRVVTQGKIIYAIDYPNHKDNFFLYSILPKEMEVNFKDGKIQSVIKKANLINELLVDCNDKSFSAYFKYGDEAVNVTLTETDVNSMLVDQRKYTIKMTNEKDTMAGFNVKKAIATSVTDPSDKIELWYTNEIQVKNSNWYNPFKEINGFLLAYSIDRYGIRMDFKAKGFEEVEINNDQFSPHTDGVSIPYGDYNKKLDGLFQSFE